MKSSRGIIGNKCGVVFDFPMRPSCLLDSCPQSLKPQQGLSHQIEELRSDAKLML